MSEARTYLEQAYRIDQRINSKIEQVASLHNLATKANSTLTDMPGSPNRNIHRMEDIIVKIVDLENDINQDIDMLVDLKTEIMQVIKKVDDLALQTLLEHTAPPARSCFRSTQKQKITESTFILNLDKNMSGGEENSCVEQVKLVQNEGIFAMRARRCLSVVSSLLGSTE